MMIDVRPLHPAKAYSSIIVTLFGIVMEVNDLQSQKVSLEIVLTPYGILIDARLVQL